MFGDNADHIWRQEGSDILKIWRSGLYKEQKDAMVTLLLSEDFKPMPGERVTEITN
jgi:hypothetical protein